jgi:Pyruvate kinase, barrel domain
LDGPIKILGNLQGPKIRLGETKEKEITLKTGDHFTLFVTSMIGNDNGASVDYPGIVHDVKSRSLFYPPSYLNHPFLKNQKVIPHPIINIRNNVKK